MQLKPITAIIVLLLVITSLLIAGCTSNTPTNTPTNTQSDTGTSDKTTFSSDRGYSITYPTAWKKDVSTNPASPAELYLYLSPTETADGVVVATKGLAAGQTLGKFVDDNLKELNNNSNTGYYKNFKILNETNSTFAGKPGHTIVWSGIVPQQYSKTTVTETSVKEMQTFVVNNNIGYVVTYKTIASDYNTYLTQAQEAINSFTVTTPNVAKTPTATPTSSTDKSSYITNQFSSDYIIVTAFSKSTNSYGNVVYKGVVTDNEKKLHPYSHKITIELTKNRDDTKTRYSQYKDQLLSSGLVKEFDYGDYMTFYDGSAYTNPNREAYLDMNEPSSINHIYNTGVSLSLGDTFMVTVDDTTKL